jgi:hypothetical protein
MNLRRFMVTSTRSLKASTCIGRRSRDRVEDLGMVIVLRGADDRLSQDGLVGKKKRAELLRQARGRRDVGDRC